MDDRCGVTGGEIVRYVQPGARDETVRARLRAGAEEAELSRNDAVGGKLALIPTGTIQLEKFALTPPSPPGEGEASAVSKHVHRLVVVSTAASAASRGNTWWKPHSPGVRL